MKNLLKNKIFIASSAGVLALAVIITAVCFSTKRSATQLPISKSSQDATSDVFTETEQNTSDISADISAETGDTQSSNETSMPPVLDVNGNPVKSSVERKSTTEQIDTDTDSDSNSDKKDEAVTTSSKNSPSVAVAVEQDCEQPKETEQTTTKTTANTCWTPPAPGEGTGGLISSGLENISVSSDSSVKKLQSEIGLEVGGKLIDAGYKTLYPNAGAPKQMVEDAVKSYAETGTVTLIPDNYGLPAIVGYYNVKLQVQGSNAAEAAGYIFNYMKNDTVFNNQVKTVFKKYQDGFLSVYQKDGYFYILFAVINKGYSNVG